MVDTMKLVKWFCSDDTGISSKAIASHMSGAEAGEEYQSPPCDPADLGRCLRLLKIFPEWKPRMNEMASVNKQWASILPHWDEAAKLMADEVGIDWSKGKSAPGTYHFMKSVGF